MRNELRKRNGTRSTFIGKFSRFGWKPGWKTDERTVLLVDIRTPDGDVLCDHLWFNLTKQFDMLSLQAGDVVQFDARIKKYEKGYYGRREDVYVPISIDYKLSHPTKLRKIQVNF